MNPKIILLLFLSNIITTNAQNVSEMFISMPDTLMPYLNASQRQELVNLKHLDSTNSASLRSAFMNDITLSTLSDSHMDLNVDTLLTIEIQRLPQQNATDSLYCILRTMRAPEAVTSAYIYNKEWQRVQEIDFSNLTFTQKPDTMPQERYEEALRNIEFPLIEAHFTDSITITAQQNVPLLFRDDKPLVDSILMRRTLKWNGESF